MDIVTLVTKDLVLAVEDDYTNIKKLEWLEKMKQWSDGNAKG